MEISNKKRMVAPGLTGLTFLGLYAVLAVLGFQLIRGAPCGFLGFFMIVDLLPMSFSEINPNIQLVTIFAFPGIIFFIFGVFISFMRQKAFIEEKKFLSRATLLIGILLTIAASVYLFIPVCD